MSEPVSQPALIRPSMAQRLVDIALDVAGLAGAGLITYGVGLIYRPAAFIVAGLVLLAVAWRAAVRGL